MCQNAVDENVEREEMLHPHQKYLAFIPLSKSQTKPGPSFSLSLPLSFDFLWHFPLILQCMFCLSDIQSRILVLNSDRAA